MIPPTITDSKYELEKRMSPEATDSNEPQTANGTKGTLTSAALALDSS